MHAEIVKKTESRVRPYKASFRLHYYHTSHGPVVEITNNYMAISVSTLGIGYRTQFHWAVGVCTNDQSNEQCYNIKFDSTTTSNLNPTFVVP